MTDHPAPTTSGPATYIVIGGGCFGSFYTRQLLRYADRAAGPVARILVVDRDPRCRVAREVSDPRVEVHSVDWAEHLSGMLPRVMAQVETGAAVADRIVPSAFASHILLESLRRAAAPQAEQAGAEEVRALFAGIGTPFARDLGRGSFALSFATWVCPVHCIEPRTCPAISAPLTWNMTRAVAEHAGARPREVRSVHILRCRHEAFGVGTIPIAALAHEAIALRRAAADTSSRAAYAVIATVSTCHGLAGALRLGAPRPAAAKQGG